jgi:FAD binding domain/Berberine and berberine like
MDTEPVEPAAFRMTAIREDLEASGCRAFEPGSDGYARAVRLWNGAVEHKPGLVAHCLSTTDVQTALRAAREHGVPISVRGGGQDWAGRSLRDGGLVINLSDMRRVSLDLEAKEATVAGGGTAADLSTAMAYYDLAAITGNTGDVGIAGLLLGGGYGPLQTRFGVASDSLLSAEVVLANGRVVTADASENSDLFWALRGGGGNFGVVTSMRLRLHAVGTIMCGTILFPWADARSVLQGYSKMMASAPAELAIGVAMSVAPDGNPILVAAPIWSGDPTAAPEIMQRLQGLGTPLMSRIAPITFGEILGVFSGQLPSGRHYAVATRWIGDLSPAAISALMAAYEGRTSPLTRIVLHHFHGAGSQIAPDATAFGMRQEHFTILIYSVWEAADAARAAIHRGWASDLSSGLAPLALPGGYANLLGPDDSDQIAAAYGANGQRLREIKKKFDPENIFSSAIPLPT